MATDTPINSWNDKSSLIQSLYKIRGRYIRTRDPLPVMTYKQLENAIPTDPYGLDSSGIEGGVVTYPSPPPPSPPPLPMPPLFGLRSALGEVTSKSVPVEVAYGAHLLTVSGFVGDEVSVELDRDLPKITEVSVNGIQVGFFYLDETTLIFVIPEGSTSGTVGLVDSRGRVIDAGVLEVVSG